MTDFHVALDGAHAALTQLRDALPDGRDAEEALSHLPELIEQIEEAIGLAPVTTAEAAAAVQRMADRIDRDYGDRGADERAAADRAIGFALRMQKKVSSVA